MKGNSYDLSWLNKTVCQCAKCKEVFDFRDAHITYSKVCGIEIKEKSCPYCGSISYTNLYDLDFLNKYLKDRSY